MRAFWIAVLLLVLMAGSMDAGMQRISFATPAFVEHARLDQVDWTGYMGANGTVSELSIVGEAGSWRRQALVVAEHDDGMVDLGTVPAGEVEEEHREFGTVRIEAHGVRSHGISVASEGMEVQAGMLRIPAVVGEGGFASEVTSLPGGGSPAVAWQPMASADSLVLRTSSLLGLNSSGNLTISMFSWEGKVVADGEPFALRPAVAGHAGTPLEVRYVHHFTISDARLEVANPVGGGAEAVLMAANPGMWVHGQAMLPRVQMSWGNPDDPISNRSLLIQGPLQLSDMEVDNLDTGRIASHVGGDFKVARVDGQVLDATIAPVAAGIGLSVALLLAARGTYAIALFTRLSPKQALEHPRRQSLHRYIQDNPGATFRELCRATQIPAGTCRHHLSVLDRAQAIVEHRHRSTVRFFENHGKFDRRWKEIVMLREPELAQIHSWLDENEGAIQKDILEHALSSWGWSRSTTQHRLQRLVDNGLIDVQEMGRCKSYSLAQSEPEPMQHFGLRVDDSM